MSRDLTPEEKLALDVARNLAENGIPLFLARPDLDGKTGAWNTRGGHQGTGYWFPSSWQNSKADPRVVDRWQPGMALCLVTGHGLDLLDVDPRNGGEASYDTLQGSLAVPRFYGRADTPSGGWHGFIASIGVRSRDGVLPGVDVKAGNQEGRGVGFAFIAPTVKLSKATGHLGSYRWLEVPDMAALDVMGPDAGSEALAAVVEEARRGDRVEGEGVAYDGPCYDELDDTQQFQAAGEVSRVLAMWRDRLKDAADWPEGYRDEDGHGWEALCRNAEWSLAMLAAAPWSPLTEDAAREAYADLLPEEMAGVEACADGRMWPGIVAKAEESGAVSPPPWVDTQRDAELKEELEREEVSRYVPGDTFILDIPDKIPAVWGEGEMVVWARGESFILAGPPGVGKTTLAGQIVEALLIGGDVLGMAVAQTQSRVLYLAMDRPQQIARSLRRTMHHLPREVLRERLVVWKGPPVHDVAQDPGLLLRMARKVGADIIVIDSVKDAAIGLSDDAVGAAYNRARQNCLANGVEVLELHHMVKKGENGTAPTTLADMYGSTWIGAGAGSVVLLWGEPGDPVIKWVHLKQPAEEVGPFQVAHDHGAGRSEISRHADPVEIARAAGAEGVTAKAVAAQMFDRPKPTDAQIMKARRRLETLTRQGKLEFIPGSDDGAGGRGLANTWRIPASPETDFGVL